MLAATTSNEELGEQIAKLAAEIHAATARFLHLIGEFDARAAWGAYGIKSCAHWLSWRCGLSPEAAREHVRVARALRSLPLISASFARGEISFSKVRALTRIANEFNEEQLYEWSRYGTAAQLEHLVRGFRRAKANGDPVRAHAQRSLSWYRDDDGSLVIKGRLSPEDGSVFLRALEEAEKKVDVSAETSANDEGSTPWERRRADALIALAEAFSGSETTNKRYDRALVVLNVDEVALAQPAMLHPGGAVSAETARRIACDAGLIRVSREKDTTIGRRTRVVPTTMRRALHQRDGTCRFPGCTTRMVDAHHIKHWAHGGHTALSNLILLCRYHHRLVHEGGYRVRLTGAEVRFFRPDGSPLDVPIARADPRAVERQNRRVGIAATPMTCASHWDGRPPDYNIAVEGLFRLEADASPG